MNIYGEDITGFVQAIQPLVSEYKIKRTVLPSYDINGRVSNTNRIDSVYGFIQPGGKRINTNTGDGMGRWVTADYTIYCVLPNYVSMGDLIFTPTYGTLKVVSVEDLRSFGVMNASLTRTSTTDPSSATNNVIYEGDD